MAAGGSFGADRGENFRRMPSANNQQQKFHSVSAGQAFAIRATENRPKSYSVQQEAFTIIRGSKSAVCEADHIGCP